MKTRKSVVALSLLAMVIGLFSPAVVRADHRGQGGARPHGGRHVMGPGPGHVPQHRHFQHPFAPRPFRRSPFVSSYFYGTGYYSPPAFYGSLGYDDGPSAGYDPPVAYAPPPVYARPPAYPPPPAYSAAPSVPFSTTTVAVAPTRSGTIDFPTGRYELRGDGMSTPYAWV